MEQFTVETCYRCKVCGRVLHTESGCTNHMKSCKYIPEVLEGQMTVDDILSAGELRAVDSDG